MREKLEAAIEANPDDDDAYAVYGDWLQSQGDPRGELIALHAAGKQDAAATLIDTHTAALLGPFADPTAASLTGLRLAWYLGFIRTIHIGWEPRSRNRKRNTAEAAADFRAYLDHPSLRFLRDLSLGPVPPSDFMTFDAFCRVLAEAAKPQTLRTLVIGDIAHWDISGTSAGPFGPILEAFPKLQSLTIHAGDISLGRLDHAELRELAVQTGGLGDPGPIVDAKLPKLEKLEIWFGSPRYGGPTDVADIAPLLTAKHVPNVRHLGLMNAAFTDEIVKALIGSPILKQITSLDLSMGTLSDDGVRAMLDAKQHFAHLDHLDLDDNALSDQSESLVKDLAKVVVFGTSQEPERVEEEDYEERYTSVGE